MPPFGRIIGDTSIPQVGLPTISPPPVLPLQRESPSQPVIDSLKDLSNTLLQAEKVTKHVELTSDARTKLSELASSIVQSPDPQTWLSNYDKGAKKIEEETLKRIRDPQLKASILDGIRRHSTFTRISVETDSIRRRGDIQNATLERNLFELTKRIPQETNEIERARLRQEGLGQINNLSGVTLNPVAAERMKIAFEQAVGKGQQQFTKEQAENMALLKPDEFLSLATNPEMFEARFSGLDLSDKNSLINTARSARHEAERIKDEQDREARRLADIQLAEDISDKKVRSEGEIFQRGREAGLSEDQIKDHRRSFQNIATDEIKIQNTQGQLIAGQLFKDEDFYNAIRGLPPDDIKNLQTLRGNIQGAGREYSTAIKQLTTLLPEFNQMTPEGIALKGEISERMLKGEPAIQVVGDFIKQAGSRRQARAVELRKLVSHMDRSNLTDENLITLEEWRTIEPDAYAQWSSGQIRILTEEETAKREQRGKGPLFKKGEQNTAEFLSGGKAERLQR